MTTSFIPKTLEELGRDLARLPEDSLILAGGTDLVIHMHSRHMRPQALLSLSDVEELRQIVITPELASIGAMATMAQVAAAADGLEDLQALAHAASDVGSPQIRNKGTIGGNVANASPAADLPPVLWLLNAQVEIMGPGGATRVIPIQELPTGAKPATILARNEVLVRFLIDRTALKGWRTVFYKLGHRSQVTISRIGMSIAILQDECGIIQDARVIVGAIKPVPYRLPTAENILRGNRPDPELGPRLGETFKGNTRRVYKEEAAKGAFANALARF